MEVDNYMVNTTMQSPGSEVIIQDYSDYISETSSCIIGILGTARKGPLKPTLVTSVPQFISTFGEPDGTSYGPYGAIHYLGQGDQVYYQRVIHGGATASAGVAGTDKITVRGKDTGTEYNGISVKFDVAKIESNIISITVNDKDGNKLEEFGDLSTNNDDPKFITKVVNTDSSYIEVSFNTAGSYPAKDLVLEGGEDGGMNATSETEDVTFTSLTFDSTLNGAKIKLSDKDFTGYFDYTLVDANGEQLESYITVSDDKSDNRYLPKVLDQYSNYVSCIIHKTEEEAVISDSEYVLSGGLDGTAGLAMDDYIGEELKGTGLYALSNPDAVTVDLVTIPGITDPSVIQAADKMCSDRGDAFLITDIPFGLRPQEATEWTNGEGAWKGKHQAFDSSNMAFYAPWGQIRDAYTNELLWLPPSVLVAPRYAYTDRVGGPWLAPAGADRGKIPGVIQLEYTATKGERDLMYGNRNVINPIVNMNVTGIIINGQKTVQRKPSALDRVNVRRLVNYVQRKLQVLARSFLFEQNTSVTWTRWLTVVEPMLDTLKNSGAITDYKAMMDETTISSDDLENGRMPGYIAIQPVKSAEFIPIYLRIDSQSTTYDEE